MKHRYNRIKSMLLSGVKSNHIQKLSLDENEMGAQFWLRGKFMEIAYDEIDFSFKLIQYEDRKKFSVIDDFTPDMLAELFFPSRSKQPQE